MPPVTQERIDAEYRALKSRTEQAGYFLNPDQEFVKGIIRGLLENEQRYGYQACPCRLAAGSEAEDRDIICPCDYRDTDVTQHGACYCALFVSEKVLRGEQQLSSIPERRLPRAQRLAARARHHPAPLVSVPLPVWRCTVCGYLCGRETPPEVCPICKVKKDRFERFL